MRKLMMLAPVMALALVSANCSGGAFNSPTSPGVDVSPSATEARGGKGGGGTTGGGGSSSLTLVMYYDANSDTKPNWGDTVTFNVSTSATTTPKVDLTCRQNGAVVFGATAGFYDSYAWPWTKYMGLSSGLWQGGAATCTAELYYGANHTTLTTLTFDVAP